MTETTNEVIVAPAGLFADTAEGRKQVFGVKEIENAVDLNTRFLFHFQFPSDERKFNAILEHE